MRKPQPSLDVKDLIDVASHWAHEDDWNVRTIYLGTLEALAEALAAGDDPCALGRHAQHTGSECRQRRCALLIPFEFERDGGARRAAEQDEED